MPKSAEDKKPVNIIPPDLGEKERVLELARKDIVTFGQLFMPEDFLKSQPAPFQFELSKMLLNSESKRKCIILPRGHSKSTMSKAALLHYLYFNPSDTKEFIAWVSEEQSQAVDHIKYIQNHIDVNPALQYYFGDLKGSKWTEKEFTTSKGDRIIAKGTTQRLRGRSQLGLRYTKIILDDFESELNTKTPERRREIKEWVMSTVEPALENEAGREGEIWLVGTIVHFDSFLQAIYDGYLDAEKHDKDYSWDVMFRKAMNPDGAVLWADYFSWDKLQATKRRFEELGLPHKFAQEFQNEARDADNMKFQTQKINWYDGQIVQRGGFGYLLTRDDAIPVNVYLGVDLAYEHQARHDFQVIFALAIDSDKNYYVLDYYREHSPLYDMPEQILKFARDYQPLKRVNVEHVGAQGVIKDAVNDLAMKDRRLIPGIARGVRPPTGIKKEDKLEALLCPIVNRGKLYMKRNQQHLIDEMFQFPKSKNDDLLDGFWLSAIHARPPKSHKFARDGFEETIDNMQKKKSVRQRISWITGQKI